MKILLTGAFGNVGHHILSELIARGHQVTCLDLNLRPTRREASKYPEARILWGDVRDTQLVAEAMRDQHVVIHLAYIIPNLSTTGLGSEANPRRSRQVNIGGTRNILAAAKAQMRPPKILFMSSLHVYGLTQHLAPPRSVNDPTYGTDHYARHKLASEALVKGSGLEWAIFRLGACFPIKLVLSPAMFEVPLSNRMEFVHSDDVALAVANALELKGTWNNTWHVGGGAKCQLTQADMVQRVMRAIGIGALPEGAFAQIPYPTDWLDTSDSQRLFKYQTRCFDHYISDLQDLIGWRKGVIRTLAPIIRRIVLAKSPYYVGKAQSAGSGSTSAPGVMSRLYESVTK